MIIINDNDLPITVADLIIRGTRAGEPTPLQKAFGMKTGGDMFSLEEIEEIAVYLHAYYETHKETGD